MAWMRKENVALLQQEFPKQSRLLEIGCGTGEEAILLAQAGHTILATDISPGMARITIEKVKAAGLEQHVKVIALPGGHLNAILPVKRFDGAYASFGSLNCEPNLRQFVHNLANLLHPDSKFVFTIMARWAFFEIGWHLFHKEAQQGVRRLKTGWQSANLNGAGEEQTTVPVRYLSITEIKKSFAKFFSLVEHFSLPLLLPPPYLNDFYLRHQNFFDQITPLERKFRKIWPLRNTGDHIAFVFRRR